MLCIARVPGAVPAIINTVPRAWVENSARRRSASGIYLGRDGFYSSVPDGVSINRLQARLRLKEILFLVMNRSASQRTLFGAVSQKQGQPGIQEEGVLLQIARTLYRFASSFRMPSVVSVFRTIAFSFSGSPSALSRLMAAR
jgi:hypothetical protein